MDANSTAQWSWPDGMATGSESRDQQGGSTARQRTTAGTRPEAPPQAPPGRERHYGPRTCRICLEVVQPSFDVDANRQAGLFGRPGRVQYVSEDPESGRLISPCKCKGSQRYVHEGCLQAWRQSAPMSERNFWRCPTCGFEYRLERLKWGKMLTSTVSRLALTLLILLLTIFALGFVADPILNLWSDPLGSIAETVTAVVSDIEALEEPLSEEPTTWFEHFLKGFFSLGLLGFAKAFFAMSPWQWWNLRNSGIVGGYTRRGGTGRARVENINLALVLVGLGTFLYAVWKGVTKLSANVLEKASERVVDVQGGDEDEDGAEPAAS